MSEQRRTKGYFGAVEWSLWLGSMAAIIAAYCLFDRQNVLNLTASLTGVTSLIFAAKGNPISQVLMIIFSILYGVISYGFGYYGEMVTYLGMTLPMAVTALVAWLRNPFEGKRSEVAVARISGSELAVMAVLTAAVTAVFYFVLQRWGTVNLPMSTLSVATSFAAVYMTYKRSPYYAVAYAANDIVLIVLWSLAAAQSREYMSVVVCFAAFLANDIYGFISWRAMERRQRMSKEHKAAQQTPDSE